MRVSVVQMNPGHDKAKNIAAAERLTEAAIAADRPDFIALPEMWTCLGGDADAKRAAAERLPGTGGSNEPGPAYTFLRDLAVKHRIVVHGGSMAEDAGEKLYNTRRGQLNVACVHCHEFNSGNYIRADLLSEGRSNGFPLYRLKWARVGSFHYRMEECYSQVRATPEPFGSEELTKLQLYVTWRSNGLLNETPGVRR